MIEAKNLTMHYGPVRAVDDVTFRIGEKQVVGLLGPNGAGKTTLMRILTTFIYPFSGTARVAGFSVTDEPIRVRREIGYLPETPPLYADMRVDDFLNFVGRARGLRAGVLRERRDWTVGACALEPVWKHGISELSLGYRRRLGLAQALIHDPKVLILDEPTSGLDPLQIVSIRKLLRDLVKTKTIVFSTHILQEAAAISDRLMIVHAGKIVAQGTVPEVQGNESSLENAFLAIFKKTAAGRRENV